MKKNLLLTLMMLFAMSSFAQETSFPTLSEQPKWYIETFYNSYTSSGSDFGFVKLSKDTAVCGQKYDFGVIENKPFFVRSVGTKTYLRPSVDCKQSEELIYDFDMKVGDTMSVKDFASYQKGQSYKFLVTAVDSVQIKGKFRKKISLKYSFFNKEFYQFKMDWIEKVGSSEHPFYPMVKLTAHALDGTKFYNLCTYNNNTLFYSNSGKCQKTIVEDTTSFPMFVNKPQWNLGVYPTFFMPPGIFRTTYVSYQKDTTICNKTYSKATFENFNQVKTSKIFVRTEGQKVFYLPIGGCSVADEKLLYDFSLNKGDATVVEIASEKCECILVVEKVEMVNLLGKMRKKMYMTSEELNPNKKPFKDIWIEGIGSLQHPFYALLEKNIDGNWTELLCLESNMVQQYENPKYSFCSFFVSTDDLSAQNLVVDIFPNPFDNSLNINVLTAKNAAHNIELFNNIGQKILEQNFETTLNISTDFLPKGIYFLKVQTADKQFFMTKKIIK